MAKLLKNCKKGDALYYVLDPNKTDNQGIEHFQVYKRYIEEIKYGSEFDGGDTFICKSCTLRSESTYQFKHENSDCHDSLILDTDYAHDDKGRYFTTYQAAVDFLNITLQCRLLKTLEKLEWVEKNVGTTKDGVITKKTKEFREDYSNYKKVVVEIYDIPRYKNKSTGWVDNKLEGKKVKVYKKQIETDVYGCEKYYGFKPYEEFVADFDSIEEALDWMHKNDKSYYEGKSDIWYEGDRYFIKEDTDKIY